MTQFELFDQEAMNQLSVALREQALQCNQSRVLMAFAGEKLYRDKIVRPSADTLERLIARIKQQVEEEISDQEVRNMIYQEVIPLGFKQEEIL